MHFVLIPGAGGAGWYWHRVIALLEEQGHTAIAVDLPADDPAAGLPAYVDLAREAVGRARKVVVVGQSLGGFTAVKLAADLVDEGRAPLELVLLNAMVPAPGETAGAWWDAVGQEQARLEAAEAGGWSAEVDLETYFLHDVDPDLAAAGEEHQREEVDAVFASTLDIDAWPDVPTRIVAGAEDRFFPLTLQQRVARDRLNLEPTVIQGGHLAALSHPVAVVGVLLAAPA